MIAALFALAAAMLVAGVTAVIEGFPYVRLESGMAMVYGGSVVGSSGVLLFGLAVVATWLRRVEKALHTRPVRDEAPAPSRAMRRPDPEPAQDRQDLQDRRDLPAPASPAAGPGATAERPRIEPSLVLSPGPGREPGPAVAAQPDLPLPGLSAPPPRPADAASPEVEKAESRDDLFVPPHAAPGQAEPSPPIGPVHGDAPLRSSLDEAPAAGPERAVVGRYSSGGNTYMMFDDGTIEAETPNGRFTFASLDELKAFVDSGGEAGARGAA